MTPVDEPGCAAVRLSVVIPAHDEAETIGAILRSIRTHLGAVVDEIVVVDDGSTDGTAALAADEGCLVVGADGSAPGAPSGKGIAMATGGRVATGDLLVFLDADVTTFAPHYVTRLVDALVADPTAVMAKATYARSLDGVAGEGGRVNALVARPLLARCFPALAHFRQPLSGECAIRRAALVDLVLEPGYGVEVGLLIDLSTRFGTASIVEVDLGERAHRNRPLRELVGHAEQIVAAVLARWQRVPDGHLEQRVHTRS